MPPKACKPTKKSAAAAKKARATPAAKAASATAPVLVQGQVPEKAEGSKKRRAESVSTSSGEEKPSKKLKVDQVPADARVNEPRELDASLKKELQSVESKLSDHTLRSMGALMDAIGFTGTRPTTVEEMVEAAVKCLEERALDSKDISKDLAAVEKVDQNHWEGEYDSDPEGFDKDVRRRLNKMEDMTSRLTKQYLKDIGKRLHFYGRGGTNADLAAEIVAVVTYKAKEGSKLKPEYSIVKGVYSMCYGCCGDDSGLEAGSDGVDSEGDEEADDDF